MYGVYTTEINDCEILDFGQRSRAGKASMTQVYFKTKFLKAYALEEELVPKLKPSQCNQTLDQYLSATNSRVIDEVGGTHVGHKHSFYNA